MSLAQPSRPPQLQSQSQPQPPPPLLLTKRLTVFLRQSLQSPLHSVLLTTSTGKLLAYASTRPAAELRTQCTVAASLWALHAAAAQSIAAALPSASPSGPASPGSSSAPSSTAAGQGGTSRPASITVQLSGGVLVVRRLRCGLLFVCVGHPPETPEGPAPPAPASSTSVPAAGGPQGHSAAATMTMSGAAEGAAGPTGSSGTQHDGPSSLLLPPGSPSEADSVLSVGAATTASYATSVGSVGAAAVVLVRRHAEDLGRMLDDKLYSLKVPDEGMGME